MTDRSQYDEALHRVDASDYQWQEHGSKGSLREAAVAQVHATLALVDELRRMNDGRDQFHREVLGFFERLTEEPQPGPDGSLRSEQPEADDLTYEQWNHHLNSWFRWRRSEGDEKAEAWRRALEEMETRFGPCPEES